MEIKLIKTFDVLNKDKLSLTELDNLKSTFSEDGVIILNNLIPSSILDTIKYKIEDDFNKFIKKKPWIGGGLVIGHINAIPPLAKTFIFPEILCNNLLHQVSGKILNTNTINLDYSANINLPGSTRQLFHSDDSNMLHQIIMISIPLGNVNELNGSTEFIPKTQYECFNRKKISRLKSERANTINGSAIIWRPSVWHRGTYNFSDKPRIMLNIKHTSIHSKIYFSTPPLLLNQNCIEILGESSDKVNFKFADLSDSETIFSKNYFDSGIIGYLRETIYKFTTLIYDKIFKKY
jgi:hypothetical protein